MDRITHYGDASCFFYPVISSLRVVPASKQSLAEHVIRHPDVMRQNCRPKTKLDPLTKEASMATKKEKPVAPETEEQEKPKGKPRNVKNIIPLGSKEVAVYATPRVAKALEEVTEDMTLYHGVRLTQLMEAMYQQGKKDGAREAFSELDDKLKEVKKAIPHRNPGKPKKE